IRDFHVTGVQTCALPISEAPLVVDALHRSIHAKLESRTTMHRYQITDMETFETQIVDRGPWFALQHISGVVPGKLYRVRVAVMTDRKSVVEGKSDDVAEI